MNKKYDKDFVLKFLEPLKLKLKDSEYKSVNKKMELECEKGHTFFRSLSKFFRGQIECPSCKKRVAHNKHTFEYIYNFILEKGETLVSKTYINANEMLEVLCEKGHRYPIRFSNFHKGHRCPECFYKKETICREIIENLVGKPFPKKRPDFMRTGEGRGKTLELDGYNEDLKIAFEYDGEHTLFSLQ